MSKETYTAIGFVLHEAGDANAGGLFLGKAPALGEMDCSSAILVTAPEVDTLYFAVDLVGDLVMSARLRVPSKGGDESGDVPAC